MALADYINNKPTIETNRLIIRPMVFSDVPALKEWLSDKSIYTYWGKAPGKAEKYPEFMFEKTEKTTKSFHLGVSEKRNEKVIGDIWVYRIENDRMAQVALRLSKDVHAKGYGTESLSAMTRFCFERTELQRLWTKVDVRNAPSCRVLEKCGYTREGLIRQGKMVNTWCDYYIYGILASDK
ncbi:MAG: GNAT family N-acetyltransferase [Lachnospiraceae bacterium]|nr:GNAT family N-acetyltransferase [Lachnospiraceae bacterium]MBR0093639.1 GNAT family N-acetyltransferase [Lachnospiraceae bacterium]